MGRCCPVWFLVVLLAVALEARATTYKDCETRRCSDKGPNISYPFFRSGNDLCGYPGFEIKCDRNGTTSFGEYVVQNISYGNRSLHVLSKHAMDDFCTAPDKKLDDKIFDNMFIQRRKNDSICFFYNCTTSPLDHLKSVCHSNDTFVMLVQPNYNLENKTLQCKWFDIWPVDLREGDRNKSLDMLDYKRLLVDGIALDWDPLLTVSSCDGCQQSGGQCGRSVDGNFVCFCPDGRSHPDKCNHGTRRRWWEVGLGIVVGGILIAMLMTAVVSYGNWKKCRPMPLKNQTGNCGRDIEALMRSNGLASRPRRYKYCDLKKFTNFFSEKLGEGGYGKVYKGRLREDDHFVAVKILKDCKGDGEEFINEVASISRTAHVNIVQLLGFCYEGNKRALLYEYMPNGSLDKFLPLPMKGSPDCPLGWKTLHRIALGIARGLEYLHRGCNTRILHFDIKPQNILLDHDFTPKISDFGLAKLCKGGESIVSMIGARGTIGYIAPEVFSRCFGSISNKSDVYSFGMLVFEMIGGKNKSNVEASGSSEMYFPEWVYNHLESGRALWMPGINSEDEEETARKMMLVSLWCIQPNPSDRPSMSRVIEMLEGSIQLLEVPPKPFLKSPPRPSLRTTASTTPSASSLVVNVIH